MELEKAFGEILRELRKINNISQEKLAHSSDLDRTYISMLERGQRQPSLKTLFQLSDSLNIKPENFVKQVSLAMKEENV